MASFKSKTRLLQKSLDRALVGIEMDKNDDNIIVTFDDQVTVYDTIQKRVVSSWTPKQGQKFTAPVIYNKEDDEYVLVIDKIVIATSAEITFEKLDKFTTNCSLWKVFPDSSHESLVLFRNGLIRSLANVFENPKASFQEACVLREGSEIIQSEIFSVQDCSHLALLYRIGKNYTLAIYSPSINAKLDSAKCTKLPFTFDKRKLQGVCLCPSGKESMLIISLWDDGSLCKSLVELNKVQSLKVQFVTVTQVVLPQVVSKLPIVALSDHAAAVVCKKGSDHVVSVVDLNFGLHHDSVTVGSGNVQLHTVKNHLILVEEGSISSVIFSTKAVNLLSVLRKQAPSPQAHLSTVKWTVETSKILSGREEDEKFVKTLLDSSLPTDMCAAWDSLWRGKSASQRRSLCSSSFMAELLHRLTSVEKLWNLSLLEKIVETGYVSTSSCPALLSRVLTRKDFGLLSCCLKHLKDIGEGDIVRCLDAITTVDSSGMETDEDQSIEHQDLLKTIFSLKYTEARLIESLRNLSFEKSVLLLKHLSKDLDTYDFESTEEALKCDQALLWMCMLFDANYTRFVVNPSAWELLADLQEAVSIRRDLSNEMAQVEVLLIRLKEAYAKPKKSTRFAYDVQIMDI